MPIEFWQVPPTSMDRHRVFTSWTKNALSVHLAGTGVHRTPNKLSPAGLSKPPPCAELVDELRCYFAVGKIRGTLRMRSDILVLLPTTKFSSKSFVFKNNGAKEGLKKDNPSGLGAGGPEFKSRRPDHLLLVRPGHMGDTTYLRHR
jgi:hypothetical protein